MLDSNLQKEWAAHWPQIHTSATERLINSPNKEDRNHIFLGFDAIGRQPVLLPKKTLFEHGMIVGANGSNKTSIGIYNIASQLIAASTSTTVFLDLKGDPYTFHRARAGAAAAGVPFYYFTNEVGLHTQIFNLFSQSFIRRVSNSQVAQQLLTAFSMDHGDVYGAAFFAAMAEFAVTDVLELFGGSIHSFVDLYAHLVDPHRFPGSREDFSNSRHLHAILARLGRLFPINATDADFPPGAAPIQEQLQVETILQNPCVVYFFLKARVEAPLVRTLAKLVLFSILTAADVLQKQVSTIPVVIFCDEARHLVSSSLPTVLEMARDLRISCILALQSLGQLRLMGDLDLTDVVMTNTAFKQLWRTPESAAVDYIQKCSGEVPAFTLGWEQALEEGYSLGGDRGYAAFNPRKSMNHDLNGPLVRVSQTLMPRYSTEDIMRVFAEEYLSFVQITGNRGYGSYDGRFVPVFSAYSITEQEYGDLKQLPWPSSEGTIEVPLDSPHKQQLIPAARGKTLPKPAEEPLKDDSHEAKFQELENRLITDFAKKRRD